jgi:hypothetical protein
LEAFAGAGLAVFFAFDGAGISGEHAGGAEGLFVFLVVFDEGAGDAETDGAGLAGEAAAGAADDDVEAAFGFGDVEGLGGGHDEYFAGEVFADGFAVNDDLAGTGEQAHAGAGFFAPADGGYDTWNGWHVA